VAYLLVTCNNMNEKNKLRRFKQTVVKKYPDGSFEITSLNGSGVRVTERYDSKGHVVRNQR
jgi:hypothetical protein